MFASLGSQQMAIVTAGRLLIKTVGLLSGSHSGTIFTLINPRHPCARRVSSFPVCLCVCVSIFSILPSHTFRHPTRGISDYSAENAVKLKSRKTKKPFSLKLLSSKVRSVINL